MNLITLTTQTTKLTTAFSLKYLIYALVLIILTIVIIRIFKNVIVNSAIGVAALMVLYYILNIKLPFILTLIVTAIFGAAGLGIMLILKMFGVV